MRNAKKFQCQSCRKGFSKNEIVFTDCWKNEIVFTDCWAKLGEYLCDKCVNKKVKKDKMKTNKDF